MAHGYTILSRIAVFLPRHEFEKLAKIHHAGRKFHRFSRWAQFMALKIGQLAGRVSLSDLVDNLAARSRRLHHLGMKSVSRSNRAKVNDKQPAALYEAMFGKLLARGQALAPGNRFRLKAPIYLLDATMIDLSLSMFL